MQKKFFVDPRNKFEDGKLIRHPQNQFMQAYKFF